MDRKPDGLKDKNNNDVFSGDIVIHDNKQWLVVWCERTSEYIVFSPEAIDNEVYLPAKYFVKQSELKIKILKALKLAVKPFIALAELKTKLFK